MSISDEKPLINSLTPGMYSISEESVEIDNQDEVTVKDRPRDVEKPALTSRTSHRHGGNRVLSSCTRSELIVRANQNHQGSASCTSFYLFFSGTFLFTMAGTLLSTGAWCFLVRLPMIHLAREPSRIIVVLSGYIFAAGALTLPTSCILYREYNVTRGHRRTALLPVHRACKPREFCMIQSVMVINMYLFGIIDYQQIATERQVVMIIMLCLSIVFLICGAAHGIIYCKSYYPFFQATAQARLQCCGINKASDWTIYTALTKPLSSCYFTSLNENGRKIVWKTGCLDAIISDLAWITAYIVGLCFISILAHILAIISAGILLWIAERGSILSD